MKLIDSLLHRSARQLTRAAAMFAILGLVMMVYSVVSPKPLAVIAAMSIGHGIGAIAVLLYLLAIVLHSRTAPPVSLRPEAPAGGADGFAEDSATKTAKEAAEKAAEARDTKVGE